MISLAQDSYQVHVFQGGYGGKSGVYGTNVFQGGCGVFPLNKPGAERLH